VIVLTVKLKNHLATMPSTNCNRGERIHATDDSVETMDGSEIFALYCEVWPVHNIFRRPKKCEVSLEQVTLFRFGLGMSLYISEVNSLDNPSITLDS
jgi:hypothetical protein